ncbi:TVP38/TMEM64 family protein [Brassicibacter mesophilus]|uniref:TVP38/TMEM64 family protein n=1 Tax=Brassicibacter mesophilus TaxID=745119 RepID=UPI003D230126
MKRKSIILRSSIFLVFIIALYIIYTHVSAADARRLTKYLIDIRSNPRAYLIYLLVTIVASLIFIPISWVKMLGGIIFGFWPGILVVMVSSNVACNINFLLARLLGKDFIISIIRRYNKNKKSLKFNISDKSEGKQILLLANMRMIPILPCSVINVLYGVSHITFKDFAIGSFLGMIPGTFVTVYFASKAIEVKDNPYTIILPLVIFIVFNAATFLYGRNKNML